MSLDNASPLVFDDTRYLALQSPGDREMFLFKWLSSLDVHLETATTKDDLKNTQERLELVLLEIAAIPSAASTKRAGKRLSWLKPGGSDSSDKPPTILGAVPKPSRVIRDLTAKCLARLYEVGQIHRMGDALYAIQTSMSGNNSTGKLSSVVCSGVLFEALAEKAGFRLLSCFADFVNIGLKLVKNTSESVLMRVEATRMLAKMVAGGGSKTASDVVARDLVKGLRANLVHKSPMLVVASAGALEEVVRCTSFLSVARNTDVHQMVASLVPMLATPVVVVRRALARLVAVLIAHNVSLAAQTTTNVDRKTDHKGAVDRVKDVERRRQARSVDVSTRTSVETPGTLHTAQSSPEPPVPETPDPVSNDSAGVSPETIASHGTGDQRPMLITGMRWLSSVFTRAQASREQRAGIIDAYAALFSELGSDAVETHYLGILQHVLGDLVTDTRVGDHGAMSAEADTLALRNMCQWLLRVPVAQRLLTERGKLMAARTIWDGYLAKNIPVDESLHGCELALLVTLHEWRQLVNDLGPCAIALDVFDSTEEECSVPLDRLLGHPAESVRVAAASALREILRANHQQLAPCLATLISRFQRTCAHCAAHTDASLIAMRRGLGYAYAIANVSSLAAFNKLEVPLDLLEWIHSISVRLLNSVYSRVEPLVVDARGKHSLLLGTGDAANVGVALGLAPGVDQKHSRNRVKVDSLALQNMRMTCGWTMLASLASLGTRFTQQKTAEWVSLWTLALPPMPRDINQPNAFVTREMPWADRAHQIQSRTMALAHVFAYLQHNQDLSVAGKSLLMSGIRAAMMFADNALDAPPPMGRLLVDPGRLAQELPVSTCLLTCHLQLRTRLAQCLRHLGADDGGAMSSAAVRMAEQAIASADNLSEIHATRMAAAASAHASEDHGVAHGGSAAASPNIASASTISDGVSKDAAVYLRGFRSGAWGYEIEVGVTSLVPSIVVVGSPDSSPLLATSEDFSSSCAFTADEFDWLQALHRNLPVAPYTQLVDSSVQMLGHLFPSMAEHAQLALLDGLVARLNNLPFNSHRYVAVLTNILVSVHHALCSFSTDVSFRVARVMVELARSALILPSPAHRQLAACVIGLLATRHVASALLPQLLDHLTDQAIRSRDRFARAGAAVALGSLYSHAGSIVAGRALKQVVVLLHSLASDNDPVVHTWAIGALADVAMAAGFMFEPHARDTFQLALKLFLSDSHVLPLYASALWVGGREHQPPNNPMESAVSERTLPLRGHASVGVSVVATGRDAAVTHPNSVTHHGRASDEHHLQMTGDYRFVCARADVDAFDARAALGHLVGSLILVFGPELQVDNVTRDSVLTLISELHRSLPSIGVLVPPLDSHAVDLSVVVDFDARWQTAAEYIQAVQKQLLFFSPARNDRGFVPRFVRQTLRPILCARRIACVGSGLLALQRVAVRALEGILRLYGDDLVTTLTNCQEPWADWSLCHVVWETLTLYNTACEQQQQQSGDYESVAQMLVTDLQLLLRTSVELMLACDGAMELVRCLCAVFTGNAASALQENSQENQQQSTMIVADPARPFNSAAKTMAAALLIGVLDAVAQTLVENSSQRVHPLTPLLADLLRAGYLASTTPTDHCWQLCCLGQAILQRLLYQFSDISDPAMPDEHQPILAIYQAQISSAFMPALSSDDSLQVFVRQAATDTAAAYALSGLLHNDRLTLVRIMRLVAPQSLFTNNGMATVPPQMLVALRLAALSSWATVYSTACCRNDRELLDVVEVHFDLLGKGWIDAIRDMAVLKISLQDVFAELESLQKTTSHQGFGGDLGVGLQLGLESTYLGFVRDTLSSWYTHYLPRFLDAVSVAVGSSSMDRVFEQKAESKPALLLLAFALQMLDADQRSNPVGDLPPINELIHRLAGSFSTTGNNGDIPADIAGGEQRTGSLLKMVRVLLDNGVRYRVADALVPKAFGGSVWLAQEIWTRAVSKWLSEGSGVAEHALDVAASLLSLLGNTPGINSTSLLVQWLFNPQPGLEPPSGDNTDIAQSLGLSSAGRLVLRDILHAWNNSNSGCVRMPCLLLNLLAIVVGAVCDNKVYRSAARRLAALWMALWKKLLLENVGAGLDDARNVAGSLARLFICANQASSLSNTSAADPDDLISTDNNHGSSVLWIGKLVNSSLEQVLEDCQTADSDNSGLYVIVACILSSDALTFISLTAQQKFVDAYAKHLSRLSKTTSSGADNLSTALQVFDSLAEYQSNISTLAIMPLFARECIPILARLVYQHMDTSSAELLDKILAALAVLATSNRYPKDTSNMVMAAVLMLLLSMLPDHLDMQNEDFGRVQIAEAILGLATASPVPFKSVLLRLSATQPIAKRRLEAAIRSRATSKQTGGDIQVENSHTRDVSRNIDAEHNEIPSIKISLKSSFEI
ncbi:hypothetical protein H4R99_001179 [Coemansia sp. RSA 1722]|nr:hypothetical protein H4R99_001179 [Coemansia sp. RSA 1722]